MNWQDLGIQIHAGASTSAMLNADGSYTFEHHARFRYWPYGELDFVDLPVPIVSVAPGPSGVAFQCADHKLYYLSGCPDDKESWTIQLVRT